MLVVVRGSEVDQNAELMDRAYRFRHDVFVDEKGWEDIRRSDGRERDRFDGVEAIHQICLRNDEIVGYQRLLPTTRPHLLNDVLRDLCHRRPPRGPRVFEWTRFEDTPEVKPIQRNHLALVASKGDQGEARVTVDTLLQASLRLRPDRIFLGEIRGAEAYSLLRAINTGHPGSITTVHADSPAGASSNSR